MHAVLAYIAYMFDNSRVTGPLLRNCVRSISGAYALNGYAAPAKPQGSELLYKDNSIALIGFTKDKFEQGGPEPGGGKAIPDAVIEKFCHQALKALGKCGLKTARAALANVYNTLFLLDQLQRRTWSGTGWKFSQTQAFGSRCRW